MDTDGDGGLNEEEFMAALRQQAADPSAWDHEDLTEIHEYFKEKARRGQPLMNWEEWQMLNSHEEIESDNFDSGSTEDEGHADDEEGPLSYDEATFRKYDLDGNGVLDRSEVNRMLGRAEALSEVAAAADELLQEIDLDLDDEVTLTEWVSSLF